MSVDVDDRSVAVGVLERPARHEMHGSLPVRRELVSEPQLVRPSADEVVVAVVEIGNPTDVGSDVVARSPSSVIRTTPDSAPMP